MKKIIFAVLLLPILAYSVPTPEGLFRNNSNRIFEGDGVAFNFNVKAESASVAEDQDFYDDLKLKIVFNKNDSSYSFIQVIYSKLNGKEIVHAVTGYDRFETFLSKVGNDKAMAFYSLLPLIGFNDGRYIFNFLKSKESGLKSNLEMVNLNKKKLLESYRDYLAKQSDNSNVNSPLNPQDPTEKQKVDELMEEPFYQNDTQYVQLVRKNNKFYWSLMVDDRELALVEKDSLRLLSISFMTEQSSLVTLKLGKGQSFKNDYVVPSTLEMHNEDIKVMFSLDAFSVLSGSTKRFSERLKEYKSSLKSDKIDKEKGSKYLLSSGIFVI